MTSITSEEVNYLVLRYLQEAGFVHSAFAFAQESFVGRAEIRSGAVPPGMLVSLLQRGLHYASIEFHLEEDGTERPCSRHFTLLEPHVCERLPPAPASAMTASGAPSSKSRTLSSSIANLPTQAELAMAANKGGGGGGGGGSGGGGEGEGEERTSKKRKKDPSPSPPSESESIDTNAAPLESTRPRKEKKRTNSRDDPAEEPTDIIPRKTQKAAKRERPQKPSNANAKTKKHESVAERPQADTTPLSPSPSSSSSLVPAFERVKVLRGHASEVITCSWNPSRTISLLASASGDGTVRLWTIPAEGPWDLDQVQLTVRVLDHSYSLGAEQDNVQRGGSGGPGNGHGNGTGNTNTNHAGNDITTMDWSPDGQILATGTSDGKVRLWNADGELLIVLEQHNGPIFQMQWSPDGRHLVSVGLSPAVAVWDIATRSLRIVFDHHSAPALDVDWRDVNIFATCSSDKQILIYSIGDAAPTQPQPLLTLSGHTDEVNSIKWSPDKLFLVSSSDDMTARVWSVAHDCSSSQETLVLAGHSKEIYTAKWSRIPMDSIAPGGPAKPMLADGLEPSSPSSSRRLWIATASFDGTVRIWDSHSGVCLHNLQQHTQPVYAIDFSPCGRYLASGSLDGALYLWALTDNVNLIKSHAGSGSIFEVAWSPAGRRIASCASDATLSVLDID